MTVYAEVTVEYVTPTVTVIAKAPSYDVEVFVDMPSVEIGVPGPQGPPGPPGDGSQDLTPPVIISGIGPQLILEDGAGTFPLSVDDTDTVSIGKGIPQAINIGDYRILLNSEGLVSFNANLRLNFPYILDAKSDNNSIAGTEIGVLRLPNGPSVGKVWTCESLDGTGAWAEPPRGLQTRDTVSKTTASLAVGASESGTISLAAAYRLYKITTSAPARVRLYTTTSKRDADVDRPIGTDPTGDHGLQLEFVSAAGLLSADLSPLVDGFDGKSTPDGVIPYRITNTGTATATITVTFIWIRSE